MQYVFLLSKQACEAVVASKASYACFAGHAGLYVSATKFTEHKQAELADIHKPARLISGLVAFLNLPCLQVYTQYIQ